jgi:CRP-like cAMP-binding protein
LDELEQYPLTGRFLMGRLRHAMTDEEKRIIEGLVASVETFSEPATILERGQLCDRSTMLIEGFVLRTIVEEDHRYIVGIQVPGDFVDLHAFALKRLDHDIVTIGATKVGFVPHDNLLQVMEESPHLARLLWFSTLLDAAIHREWIMKMEQLPAANRAAHVFCELWERLDFVGLGGSQGIRTPLIQADLANMCGTTAIHMNRALGQMRKDGLADFRRGALHVADRARLAEFGHFDPAYLYGEGPLRMEGDLR